MEPLKQIFLQQKKIYISEEDIRRFMNINQGFFFFFLFVFPFKRFGEMVVFGRVWGCQRIPKQTSKNKHVNFVEIHAYVASILNHNSTQIWSDINFVRVLDGD